MSDSLDLRDARADDLPAIQRIYAEHVLHGLATFELEPPSVEEMRRRHAEVLGHGLPYLVAEQAGEVLGYGYATPYRPRPAYRFTVEDSIYLRADLGARGIGSGLLGELIARCERGPWRQMIAVIGNSENAASIRLHQRLGFHHVGTFEAVGFKHGRWVDTLLMQRALGEGGTCPPID
jgi:L-amino acid N-acyltransferase YncA